MNKQEYLDALGRALAQMPGEEREKQIAYYDELIQDMCEDGMSETEARCRSQRSSRPVSDRAAAFLRL